MKNQVNETKTKMSGPSSMTSQKSANINLFKQSANEKLTNENGQDEEYSCDDDEFKCCDKEICAENFSGDGGMSGEYTGKELVLATKDDVEEPKRRNLNTVRYVGQKIYILRKTIGKPIKWIIFFSPIG